MSGENNNYYSEAEDPESLPLLFFLKKYFLFTPFFENPASKYIVEGTKEPLNFKYGFPSAFLKRRQRLKTKPKIKKWR